MYTVIVLSLSEIVNIWITCQRDQQLHFLNGTCTLTTMGNKSSKKTVSRDSENAAEISKERPTSELHSKANASYDEYDNYTTSVESNRLEIKTNEHSYAPCEIKEPQETHGEETKKKNEIQGICEIEEEQGLNQPYVAIER